MPHHRAVAAVVLHFLAFAPSAHAQPSGGALTITHQPPACLEPGKYSEIRARITPIAQVVRARVLFRTDESAEPHAVEMRPEGDDFVGVLPKPNGTPPVAYYWIEATNPAVEVSTTPAAMVLITTCSSAAPTREQAVVEVTAPDGSSGSPAGFGEGASGTSPENEQHVGVFNLGATGSLIAALGVGTVAATAAVLTNNDKVPPAREPEIEDAGVRVIDAPASGTAVRLATLRIVVRAVAAQSTFGMPRLELLQQEGGTVCAESPARGSLFLEAHLGQNITFPVLNVTGACGDGFEANVVRFRLTDILGRDAPGGALPPTVLPLRYTVLP